MSTEITSKDIYRLTKEFVESDFYKFLFRDYLDTAIETATQAVRSSQDPYIALANAKRLDLIVAIKEDIQSWLEPDKEE